MKRELDWLALSLVPQLGIKTLQALLGRFESIENILSASMKDLTVDNGVSVQLAERIVRARESSAFKMECRLLEEHAIKLLCLESVAYPESLRQINSPPAVLYCKGQVDCLSNEAVAFVGTRNCTSYGIKHTRRLVHELAQAMPRLAIVSGLAKGVDTVAHNAALEYGLPTVAVLAGGLSHIYPPENKELAEKIAQQGCVVSEFPIAIRPARNNFPIRNRVISGLSKAVVVTEAGTSSGALITAKFAMQQNRELFALPGSVDAPQSMGPNQLIARNQAMSLIQANDLIQELQPLFNPPQQLEFAFAAEIPPVLNLSEYSKPEKNVLKMLSEGDKSLDELIELVNVEISVLMSSLVELEVQDLVACDSAQVYRLTKPFRIED